jgi:hypothetical protein
MLAVNFLELRKGEVRAAKAASPHPDRPGTPKRGCSHHRVLCARTAGDPEAFLSVWGGAEGFSKNDPIEEKLYAVSRYQDEGAQNPLTVNNSINELAK